jgi:hypothetical protein
MRSGGCPRSGTYYDVPGGVAEHTINESDLSNNIAFRNHPAIKLSAPFADHNPWLVEGL